MNAILRSDLYRYNTLRGFKGFLKAYFSIPGFRFMYFLRNVARRKKYSPAWIFYSFLRRKYSIRYGIQIHPSTQIGAGFCIGHFGNIVINRNAVIGKNCNIAHGTTIGQANRGVHKGSPVIGDNVWMGTGAVIVGKIRVGNNVLIAPLTYVNFDIPDDSLVVGNPARIIKDTHATEDYICHTLQQA